MKRADREAAAQLVGKAFRCPDGLVRWITGLSTRGYYSMLWLDEKSNTWFSGGIAKVQKWHEWYGGAEEAPAPQAGESYLLAGAMGLAEERRAGATR